jgi:hypothetical protein
MRKLYILVFVLFVAFQSCKKANSSYEDDETESFVSESESSEAYPDGTYAADVEYYNPDTGTRNTYTLNVEVESNEVTVIHWPNRGWLDDSHFSSQELDSSGYCSFTSDQGYEYSIQITGSETSYTDEGRARSDSEDDQAAVTCSECGGTKYSYDDVCSDCKGKKKDIKEHTCKRCGEYDTFMWSSDDLCSDCKRDDKDKKRQEEEEQ